MENPIQILQLNEEIIKILKEHNINKIEQLTKKSRKQLKEMGLFRISNI